MILNRSFVYFSATRLISDASDFEKDLLTFPASIEDEPIADLSPTIQWSAVKKELQDDALIPVAPGGGWLDLPALDLPETTAPKASVRAGAEIQDSIDFLRNLNVGTEKFDLLSYLYEVSYLIQQQKLQLIDYEKNADCLDAQI